MRLSDFIFFFLLELATDIDFSRGVEFLDQELLKLLPESGHKNRVADKLIKFYLKDGNELWFLAHIEIQG